MIIKNVSPHIDDILWLNQPSFWPFHFLNNQFINSILKRQPVFVLTVAYSATVQLTGLSGAGETSQLRELTAAADAEILAYGRAHCLDGGVPSNPTGAPGPSIISRAAFNLLPGLKYVCVDAGLKTPINIPGLIKLAGSGPALDVTSGQTLGSNSNRAKTLFEAGLDLGENLGRVYQNNGYLILAESVPGGTTTALGVLLALGLDAEERVSSSMPGNAHALKIGAVEAGLKAAGSVKGGFNSRPLEGVAALGDPMQPAVAGMALAASAYCPVLLGGGTQMAAVLALAAAVCQHSPADFTARLRKANFKNIALATTRWVSSDPTASLAMLGAEIENRLGPLGSPYFASNLNFSGSRYPQMRLYEEGYVKEGVGAGASAMAAMLAANLSAEDLLPHIEKVYEDLVLK